MRPLSAFFGTLMLVIGFGAAQAEIKNPSAYRKVVNNVGNFIFSTKFPEFGKEDAYSDVRTEFTAPEGLYYRAYFARTLKEYERKGTLYNSLRNDGTYYTLLTVRSLAGNDKYDSVKPWTYDAGSAGGRDQAAGVLNPNDERCNWKSTQFPSGIGCFDFTKAVKALAERDGKALPYRAEVCLTTYVHYADTRKAVWDDSQNALVEQFVLIPETMSTGCFGYTVK